MSLKEAITSDHRWYGRTAITIKIILNIFHAKLGLHTNVYLNTRASISNSYHDWRKWLRHNANASAVCVQQRKVRWEALNGSRCNVHINAPLERQWISSITPGVGRQLSLSRFEIIYPHTVCLFLQFSVEGYYSQHSVAFPSQQTVSYAFWRPKYIKLS